MGAWAVSASNDTSTKTERNLIVEGNKLFNKENYHAALEKYQAAIDMMSAMSSINGSSITDNSAYAYAMYNKAVTLDKLASDDNKGTEKDPRVQAGRIFEEIAKMKDSNPDLAAKSFYNLGNMAFNDNNFGQAVKMYKNSLKIEPNDRQCRQNLLLAMQKQEEQEQNQDQDQNQEQDQQQQEQQQQNQDQQEQEQQQQEQQPQPMTQSAEQLLQAMQNKENATRRRTNQEQAEPARRTTDKPW